MSDRDTNHLYDKAHRHYGTLYRLALKNARSRSAASCSRKPP